MPEIHPLSDKSDIFDDAETRAFAERNNAGAVLGDVARLLLGVCALVAVIEVVLTIYNIQ